MYAIILPNGLERDRINIARELEREERREMRNYGAERELGQNLSEKLFISILLYCRSISVKTGQMYTIERDVIMRQIGVVKQL